VNGKEEGKAGEGKGEKRREWDDFFVASSFCWSWQGPCMQTTSNL